MTVTLFGPGWFVVLLAVAAVGVLAHLVLRGRTMGRRRRGLAVLAGVDVLASVVFHVAYLTDPDVHFPLWQNLPLHLCTIVSYLVLPAVLTTYRPVQTLCFFPGAVAGLLACFSAAPMYFGHDLLSAKTCFFVAHLLNFVIPVLMASLGLYRPTYADAARAVLYAVVLGLTVLPVTLLLRAVADPGANYMFVFDPEGAALLEAFHRLVPVPVLYLVPLIVAVLPVFVLQVWVYRRAAGVRTAAPSAPGSLTPAAG
ncbi:hypothetical protein [Georgenia alba]|uniref:TIGR02206 family membrane protein n=1 Tax=Georgenia alba TaxID=2233858 RepID=A0ABW2QB66_9MICO